MLIDKTSYLVKKDMPPISVRPLPIMRDMQPHDDLYVDLTWFQEVNLVLSNIPFQIEPCFYFSFLKAICV